MATPGRRNVHWTDPGSPSSDFSDDSIIAASSLEYVNSQLVAHGFASAPGISLDGLDKGSTERVLKCLLDLLAQRMKDMSRTEQLATELRTLRYDHERMASMHQSASESAANFEREVNTQKSRVASTTKALQASELAHKQTSAELQRTRGALQTVRVTHQAELKKKEKEAERMVEKWNKIADSQVKLGATASGLRFSGSAINAAVESASIRKTKNFLEVALDESEKARELLGLDNIGLKKMVQKAVNEIHRVVFEMQRSLLGSTSDAEAPVPMTLTELFPLSPPDFTTSTLTSALKSLRDILPITSLQTPSSSSSSSPVPNEAGPELERLQNIIEQLTDELRISQEAAASQVAEKASTDSDSSDKVSIDLLTVTTRDEERERLEALRKELEEERKKITETAIQLGQDRVSIKAERARLKEEKRSWQAQMMHTESPPALEIEETSHSKKDRVNHASSPSKPSPRKGRHSPSKRFQITVGRGKAGAGSRKTAKARSSSFSSACSSVVEPPFETEVIPPSISVAALSVPVPPPMSSSNTGSLLPTTFVLPPPSPCASLPPPKPTLLLSGASSLLPPPSLPLFPPPTSVVPPSSSSVPSLSNPDSALAPIPVPETPLPAAERGFPVAKPLATRMIHAYSPARPSPLSRILMLGNSPNSPSNGNAYGDMGGDESGDSLALPHVPEEDSLETEIFSVMPQSTTPPFAPDDDEEGLTLAQQLGVSESPPERLHEKKPHSNNGLARKSAAPSKSKSIPPTKSTTARATSKGVSNSRSSVVVGKTTSTSKVKTKSTGPTSSAKNTVAATNRLATTSSSDTVRKEKENTTSKNAVNPEDGIVGGIKSKPNTGPRLGGVAPRRAEVQLGRRQQL